jgi:hypothetical protein
MIREIEIKKVATLFFSFDIRDIGDLSLSE